MARSPLEQVVDSLPQRSKVLLVSQGLFYQHPECPDPIEGDWSSLVPILVKQLENQRKEKVNRNKSMEFDVWEDVESNLTNEEREEITEHAKEHGDTHILFYQATKKYVWNQPEQRYTLSGIDWTLRLTDVEKDQTRFVQGFITDWAHFFNSEAIPVSCSSQR